MGSQWRTMYQYLIVFVGCTLAAPVADERPYGPPPPAPVYKAKPAPYKEPDYKPQPYEYKYGVADDYSKSAFDKVETQDEYGKVVGSYKVNLPDGRVQLVSYTADGNGVVYDVQYQGEPSYPPPPPGGYGPYKGPGAYPGPKPGGYANDPAPPAPVYAPRTST